MLRHRLRQSVRDERGMTLTELLVVGGLLGIVLPVVFAFVLSASRSERVVTETTQQQQEARTTLESFSRIMRKAGYPHGHSYDSSSIFAAASTEDVTFYSDIDQDGVNERIRYRLVPETSTIERTIVEPDCSGGSCAYTGAGATSTTITEFEHVRNGDMTPCGADGGTTQLFRYYTVDRGSGAQTEITGSTIDALVDINFVRTIVVVDVTPERSPVCQRLETGVSLRNWRG